MKYDTRLLPLILLVTLVACQSDLPSAVDTGPEASAGPPNPPRIAFVSTRNGNQEIYSMTPLGNAQTNLSVNPANDYDPAWSPGGARIAFIRDLGFVGAQVFVMNANGSGQIRVTPISRTNHTDAAHPVWSPTGEKLAFERGGKVYAINNNGTGQVLLSPVGTTAESPRWSPDGTRIAFAAKDTLYVVNADGTNRKRIIKGHVTGGLDWAPNIQIVVGFERNGAGIYGTGIWRINADGTGLTPVVRSKPGQPIDAFSLRWSPAGDKVAFLDNVTDEVEVINTNGTGLHGVAGGDFNVLTEGWSPDGKQLVYEGNMGINARDVYRVNVDGTGGAKLTKLGTNYSPVWRPN